MSQMNLSQLVNLNQVQPSVQITPPPVEYTQGGVVGGQIQAGSPGVVMVNYAPPDEKAAMFFALAEMAKGIQTGINTFDQIATYGEKQKIKAAEDRFNEISNDENLTPELKEEQMNEYLAGVNTTYLGNQWRKSISNQMGRYWTSTEAQTQFYMQKWEQFIADTKTQNPEFTGTEEQLEPLYTQFYNKYPNAENIPRITNEKTRNDRILKARKLERQENAVLGAAQTYFAQARPDQQTLNDYLYGDLSDEQRAEIRYQFSFYMPIIDKYIEDPTVKTDDFYGFIVTQFDDMFWRSYLKENPNLDPEIIRDYREKLEPIFRQEVAALNTIAATANRKKREQDAGIAFAIVEQTGTPETLLEAIVATIGNLSQDVRNQVFESFISTAKKAFDRTNPKVDETRYWSGLSAGEKVGYLRKYVEETTKRIIEGKKLNPNLHDYMIKVWQTQVQDQLLDQKDGYGIEVTTTVDRSVDNLKEIAKDVASGTKTREEAGSGIIAQTVTLERFLTGHTVKIDDKGNPIDSLFLGLVFTTDEKGNRTVTFDKNIETWVEELKTNQPEVYKRLEATSFLKPQGRVYLAKIQEGLRNAYRDLMKEPEQRKDTTVGPTSFIDANQRHLNSFKPDEFLKMRLAKQERDQAVQTGANISATTYALAKTYDQIIMEGNAFATMFNQAEGFPGFPHGIYYSDDTGLPLTSWPTVQDWKDATAKGWLKENGDLTPDGQRAYARTYYYYQTLGRFSGETSTDISTTMNAAKDFMQGLYTDNFFGMVKNDPAQAYLTMAIVSGLSSSDPRGTRLNGIFGTGSESLKTTSLLVDQFRKSGIMIPTYAELDTAEKELGLALTLYINRISSQGSGNMRVPDIEKTGLLGSFSYKDDSPAGFVSSLVLMFDPTNSRMWNEKYVAEISKTIARSFSVDKPEDYPILYADFAENLGLPDWNENVIVSSPQGKVNWKDQDPEWKLMYAIGKYINHSVDNRTFFTMILGIPNEAIGTVVDRQMIFRIAPDSFDAYSADGKVKPPQVAEKMYEFDSVENQMNSKGSRMVRDGMQGVKRSELLEAAQKQNLHSVTIGGNREEYLDVPSFSYTPPWLTAYQTGGFGGAWGMIYYDLNGQRRMMKGQHIRINDDENSPTYYPETTSEFVIDRMISVSLDVDENETYEYYKSIAKDLGQTPLDLTQYNNKVAEFRKQVVGNRQSQYRNSSSPTLWEFMLVNHNIDLTGLQDDKDNRRNIVSEEPNGYLTVRIPGVDGKFKTETLQLFKGLVGKQEFTTTKEYYEYREAIEEQQKRLLGHRIWTHYEQPKRELAAELERKRIEGLTTYVTSDYEVALEPPETTSLTNTSGSLNIIEQKVNSRPSNTIFYRDLPVSGSLRQQDKGYFGDFFINTQEGERIPVREFPMWTGFKGKNDTSIDLEIPILVPTLTSDEIIATLKAAQNNEKPPAKVIAKAQKHALERLKAGLSPFYTSENSKDSAYSKKRIKDLQGILFD